VQIVVRLIEETLDKITAIKQQEAGEKSRATRQHVQPPMSIEDIQTRCVVCGVCVYMCVYYVYFYVKNHEIHHLQNTTALCVTVYTHTLLFDIYCGMSVWK